MSIIKRIRSLFSKKAPEIIPEVIEPRMYVVIREDLAYKYIQGSHAVAKFALDHPDEFSEWNNGIIVYLSVFNGLQLRKLVLDLSLERTTNTILDDDTSRWFPTATFIEPDLESPLPTAVAMFENGTGVVKRLLSDIKLATK